MSPTAVAISPSLPAAAGWCQARAAAQLQRFELKYLVEEDMARALRQFVRCYLGPDEFAANAVDCAYPVHSLYLDSPDLALYAATTAGERNRFKLRVRFYSDAPDAPVFFEIKRRCNETISKLRAAVRRDAVGPLLAGAWPAFSHLVTPRPKQFFALQEFCRLVRRLDATPRSHVVYQREAWASRADNSLRVTFDREVRCEAQFHPRLHAGFGAGNAVAPFAQRVICEIKFTDRMPNWCGEMIRAFGLLRAGAAKYAEGVALLGEQQLCNSGVGLRIAASPDAVREPILSGHTAHAW